ncbi:MULTISPECIES: hypothetical protein [unclassified Roseateles]|uniref:hypothetical protein n=1 Tax=unclassified Roseateles TaxID=2626991 RepID=UPI000715C447|nr:MULTISPECIES: hypothetical protein [unclassified Roseateles]KQW51667.1 hypothetical protein ASC81_03325 [Pelomonas sp. Root405]KRA77900.1 hypothetical protein ASD88_03325 [Pelomonas sp. Root662]
MKRLLALLLLAPLAVSAEPFVPKDDADIVQRLPYRVDATERARRAALARDPAQLPLAAATARAALQRARVHGDPRELGVAQAALSPWWRQADAPAEAVLLRARVLQARHEFDAARADLRALLARQDLAVEHRAQALLDAAALHQLQAELPAARALCEQLQALAPLPAAACQAELASLTGQGRAAALTLAQLSPGRSVAPWLALMRAELAERLGDETAAPTLYRTALAGEDGVYTRAALADWLLARNRAAEALTLVERSPDAEADALLLRRVIALRQLGRDTSAPAALLRERLAAADRREPGKHAREQARFALDVEQQPREALRLAQLNWATQREPADALLLLRAALAAGKPGDAARQDLARVLRELGWQDARLAALDRSFAS